MQWAEWDTQLPGIAGMVFVIVLAVLMVVLGVAHWQRGHLGWRQVVLELLRGAILVLLLFTIVRPERVLRETLKRNPEVVILTDDTGSMKTEDVLLPTNDLVTRRHWVEQQVKREFWLRLTDRYKVHREKLSDYSRNPEGPTAPRGSNLNEALRTFAERYDNLRAVLVVSDGDWNLGGSPMAAATQIRMKQGRIFTVAVGSDEFLPDLAIEDAKAPAFCLHKERVVIPFRLQSRMPHDLRVKVKLTSSLSGTIEKEVFVPAGQAVHETILWQAKVLGEHTLTLDVPKQKDEHDFKNNKRMFKVSVREEQLQVLVVDSLPRWEYRFLRNALSRDPGVTVHCLLMHPGMKRGGGKDYIKKFPEKKDEISKYDVVFLGDVGVGGNELTADQLELVKGIVEQQGSGLVFLPGIRGRHLTWLQSPVKDMLPVVLDAAKPKGISFRKESKLALTSLGSDHLLTMLADSPSGNSFLWRNLPGFYWNAAVKKAKPGADVLAVHATLRNQWGRLPLLVARPYGNGNVLFMGTDSAWRWRRGVEDTYHYRFWGQVVRWMAHPRHLSHDKGIRVFYTPENPQQGEEVFFQATVFDQSGFPLTKGTVMAGVSGPAKKGERLELTPVEGGWGVFQGSFTPQRAGAFKLEVECPEAGHRLVTEIQVGQKTLEKVGQPARFGSLQDISRLTKGSFGRIGDLDRLVEEINLLPKEEDIVRRLPLWSSWWWGVIILGLFSLYWILRKKWGLI